MSDAKKPKSNNSESERELDKAQQQFEAFDASVKDLTMDRMNQAPKMEVEPQTKISQDDIAKKNEVYLKPKRYQPAVEKFNEKFRAQYEFDKEYVNFIAEHKEIIGETLEFWTKPYPGMPCEEWNVPTNKPVWAPRYVAEQIKRKSYHRLRTEDRTVEQNGFGTITGQLVVDTTVQRLDAIPVSSRKSIFMGKSF